VATSDAAAGGGVGDIGHAWRKVGEQRHAGWAGDLGKKRVKSDDNGDAWRTSWAAAGAWKPVSDVATTWLTW
jgi:hypothetical protein